MTTRSIYGLDPSKYPSNMGKAWKEDEVIKLLTSIQKKKSIEAIASEHGRTVGGINSRRRHIAADYYFNDKRPIDEIVKFTGLTVLEVHDAINRREKAAKVKEPLAKESNIKVKCEDLPVKVYHPPICEHLPPPTVFRLSCTARSEVKVVRDLHGDVDSMWVCLTHAKEITKDDPNYYITDAHDPKTLENPMVKRRMKPAIDTRGELDALKADIAELKKDVKEILRLMNAVYDFQEEN